MTAKWETMDPQKKMQVRINFLEKLTQENLFGLNLLASLGELQHNASLARDPSRILEIAAEHLNRLVDFRVRSFFMVDEKNSRFILKKVEPEGEKDRIQNEVDEQIENGSFAWALNQNRPVVVTSEQYEKPMILHVLATKSRVRGMFAGVLSEDKKLDEMLLYPLSIILQSTANSLESAELYEEFFEQSKALKETVDQRTPALEGQDGFEEERSDRRLAEEPLRTAGQETEAADRAKSEFLSNLSHEMRAPLNTILGYGEILQYEARNMNRPDFVKDLKSIETAGKQLLGLVNDILDLSKIQAGKMEVRFETFKIAKVVEEVMGIIRPITRKKPITVEVTYPMAVPHMVSDEFRVRQILLNLLSNACKFTEKGLVHLKVVIKTVDGADWVDFVVTDTGIGIPSGNIPGLFEEFSRIDGSATSQPGGMGLGLAVTRRLCRMLGGDISVSSELGKGSVFTASLPLEARTPGTEADFFQAALAPQPPFPQEGYPFAEEKSGELEEPSRLKRYGRTAAVSRVLVVVNDAINRGALCRILGSEGWKTLEARDAETALRILERETPGLILLDLALPQMNGFEFLVKFRQREDGRAIPVIVISARDLTSEEKLRLQGQVDGVFKKGDYTKSQLFREIRKVTERSDTQVGPLDLGLGPSD